MTAEEEAVAEEDTAEYIQRRHIIDWCQLAWCPHAGSPVTLTNADFREEQAKQVKFK